jgi:DNA primase
VCSQYLLDRGFLEEWIWHYGIGMDVWSNELVIATKDLAGGLVGITRRVAAEGFQYYHSRFPKSNYLWGLDLAVKSGESTVYVTEGQADPLGLSPLVAPCSVVSSYGSDLSKEQAALLSQYFATVVLAYDNDSAGYRGVDRAVPILRSCGATDLFVLDYDANDPGKLPGVDNPNLQHLSYIRWRRIKERPPIKRKRNHATWKQCG